MSCFGQQQRRLQNRWPTARVPTARPFQQPVSLTYRVLLGKLHQTVNLRADLLSGTQDVIALLLPDLLETHLLLWGGQAAGIVCPIPPCAPLDQVVALVRMVGAKVLVAAGPEVSQDLWRKAELLRREEESINVVLGYFTSSDAMPNMSASSRVILITYWVISGRIRPFSYSSSCPHHHVSIPLVLENRSRNKERPA